MYWFFQSYQTWKLPKISNIPKNIYICNKTYKYKSEWSWTAGMKLLGLPSSFPFSRVHVQLSGVSVHRCILGSWSTKNAINGGHCVSPYVLRYLQLELTRFYSMQCLGESSSLRKNWENFHLFGTHSSTSRAPKKSTATSHGEPWVNHTIMDNIRWKTVEYLLPPHFLNFLHQISMF